jgi:hypothetical protein
MAAGKMKHKDDKHFNFTCKKNDILKSRLFFLGVKYCPKEDPLYLLIRLSSQGRINLYKNMFKKKYFIYHYLEKEKMEISFRDATALQLPSFYSFGIFCF